MNFQLYELFYCFSFFSSLFFSFSAGYHVYNYSLIVLAAVWAGQMLQLWMPAFSTKNRAGGLQSVMGSPIGRMSPSMSHSDNHGLNITEFRILAILFADFRAVSGLRAGCDFLQKAKTMDWGCTKLFD